MNSMKSIFTGSMLGLGLVLAAGQPAHALQAVWDGAYTQVGSHYAEWNIFSDNNPGVVGIQDNTPEVSHIGGGAYQVAEMTAGAFITSGGNIYSPTVPTVFNVSASSLGAGTSDVYLRVGSLGNFDTTLGQSFTNFTLNGIGGTYTQLFNEALGPGQGTEVEALVSWLGVTHTGSLNLAFNAIGTSVSLDQLSLDVAAVPVPAAVYLMGSGLAGIAAMARRRQRAV